MRKNDKIKNMELANKKLLGERLQNPEEVDNVKTRIDSIKQEYGVKDQDCKEIAFKLWNHLIIQGWGNVGNEVENRNHFEEMWDWYSKNDEDFYDAGNRL